MTADTAAYTRLVAEHFKRINDLHGQPVAFDGGADPTHHDRATSP